jgi:hypothetical protein
MVFTMSPVPTESRHANIISETTRVDCSQRRCRLAVVPDQFTSAKARREENGQHSKVAFAFNRFAVGYTQNTYTRREAETEQKERGKHKAE